MNIDLDPLPERDERFWDSANDISLSSLRGLDTYRPHNSNANSNSNSFSYSIKDEFDSNNNATVTGLKSKSVSTTTQAETNQQNISRSYSHSPTSATSCVTTKIDPDKRNKQNTVLRRSQLKLPHFSSGITQPDINTTPSRSLSLPEKIWNELLGRNCTNGQTRTVAGSTVRPVGLVKKVNFNNRPTVYSDTTAAMPDEDGLEEIVSTTTVETEQPVQKRSGFSTSRWKFFTKSFRKRKSFKIKKTTPTQQQIVGESSLARPVLRPELLNETQHGPKPITPPNFFRSFRLKRNKVKAMRPEGDTTATGAGVAPGTKNPGFLSSPFNRRRGGAGRLNPHLFSSLYHRGRSKFSAAELDDVTLDLSSGELVKTEDGTLIGRNDIVRVTPGDKDISVQNSAENSEDHEQEYSPSVLSKDNDAPEPHSYSGLGTKQVGDEDEELSPRSSTSTNTGDSSSSFTSSPHNNNNVSSKSNNFRRPSRSSQTPEETRPGTSPTKSLFGKVKEMGKNQKRKFSLSKQTRKDSQGSAIEEVDATNDETWARAGNPVTSSAIDIIGTSAQCGSSEEELSSIPNSAGRGSLSLSETEEYNGPFVGRALANVDFISSPYDRHALSYKKGDLVEIIQKRPTGSWIGKVNNKIGSFKFINVDLLPDYEDFDENDIDENYQEDRDDERHSHSPANSDYRSSSHYTNATHINARRRTKRLTPLTAWELEQRQTVANVINGIRKENAALSLRQQEQQQQQAEHGKTLDLSESPFHVQATQGSGRKISNSSSSTGNSAGRRKGSSSGSVTKKGRPKSVGDLLRRINLEEHISVFILHGFDSLDIFQELEEEDLDRLAIHSPAARKKILTAVELLREYAAGDEIPPIIIPTYSSASQMDLLEDVQDHLNHILDPPASFSRGSQSAQAKLVRDSGVFLKCEESEDPEVDEIILSPSNLPMTSMTLNLSDAQILAAANAGRGCGVKGSDVYQEVPKGYPSLEEHYGEVRQRFLHAKLLFETAENGQKSSGNQHGESNKNQFLYCEKSSDSGISLGANSPPPNTRYD